MLQRSPSYPTPVVSVKPPVPTIDGHTCAGLTKSQRAVLAAQILAGAANLRPTIKIVAAAVGVSPTYVMQAARLSQSAQWRVRHGAVSLRELTAPERFKAAAAEVGADAALELLAALERAAA
jgi:hypothetical protein